MSLPTLIIDGIGLGQQRDVTNAQWSANVGGDFGDAFFDSKTVRWVKCGKIARNIAYRGQLYRDCMQESADSADTTATEYFAAVEDLSRPCTPQHIVDSNDFPSTATPAAVVEPIFLPHILTTKEIFGHSMNQLNTPKQWVFICYFKNMPALFII